MVSELSLDLFSQSNNVIWTKPYLGFDWFGTILGAFLSTESVLPRFTFQSKCVCFAFRALLHCQGALFSLEQVLRTSPPRFWLGGVRFRQNRMALGQRRSIRTGFAAPMPCGACSSRVMRNIIPNTSSDLEQSETSRKLFVFESRAVIFAIIIIIIIIISDKSKIQLR